MTLKLILNFGTRQEEIEEQLTALLHSELFATEDVMQQVLHVERTQAHQTLRGLLSYQGVTCVFISAPRGSSCECSQSCVGGFPTRAVQAASQLGGHHLHDESNPEPEHVPEQSGLGAHVHG